MERSLNHCFTTWLNPYDKRGRYKKKEKMERKRLWVRLSGNLIDPNWRLCFPALLRRARNLDSISQADKWLLIGHSLLPLQAASRAVSVRRCGHLPDYPAGYIFIESILFTFCPQRFTLRLNSGALTMADEVSFILLTAPLPIFSLFGRLIAQGCFTVAWKGIRGDATVCHWFCSRADNDVVPSMKKKTKKFVPSVIVSSNKHQRGQLLCVTIQVNSFLGKCFFLSLPRRRDGVPLFPRPNGISRASATPAVTVLSTSHLSSEPLMWLIHSLWSKWFWNGGWAGWEAGQHLLGMFLLMPDSRSRAPLTGRKDWGQRCVRVQRGVQVAEGSTDRLQHIKLLLLFLSVFCHHFCTCKYQLESD